MQQHHYQNKKHHRRCTKAQQVQLTAADLRLAAETSYTNILVTNVIFYKCKLLPESLYTSQELKYSNSKIIDVIQRETQHSL